jgi:GNAT superfamily N-acetyltransferase
MTPMHEPIAVTRSALRVPSLPRTCSLISGIRVERGNRDDWLALAPLHYRSHQAGAVTDVFRMVYAPSVISSERSESRNLAAKPVEAGFLHSVAGGLGRNDNRRNVAGALGDLPESLLIGVIVYSRPALSLSARDRATGGRYSVAGMGRMAMAQLVNEELRVISRVVVAPNWRGLGLGVRLVAETLRHAGTPYVEALAAMGQMHPMFTRAGMTAYPQPPSNEAERLQAALDAAGLVRTDRRNADALAAAISALMPEARALANREIARWARSYLGAKNHKTNRPDWRRMLDLVARHLDSSPVYYLWRAPVPVPVLALHSSGGPTAVISSEVAASDRVEKSRRGAAKTGSHGQTPRLALLARGDNLNDAPPRLTSGASQEILP